MACIFCKIINKEISAKIIYEDSEMVAFHDIHPSAPVHILVIPKKHIQSFATLDEEDKSLVANMLWRIHLLAKELGIDEKGFRVQTNTGKDGGQVVLHLHWHLLGGTKLS